jgi:transposase
MTRLLPALALPLEGKDTLTAAMLVIEGQAARIKLLEATIDELRAGSAVLRAERDLLQAEKDGLLAQAVSKDATIQELRGSAAKLEAQVGRPTKTPKNSSIPPSRGMKPGGDAVTKPKPKRRVHPGASRLLCDNPTSTRDMKAQTCQHCQTDVSGVMQIVAEEYDHVEIPIAPAEITRILLRGGRCPCCAGSFKAPPPPDMQPGSPYGENLRATVVYMRHQHAVSYERLSKMMSEQFKVNISEGALASMLLGAAPRFAVQALGIRDRLLAGTRIESDETSFRIGKGNGWIWVFGHGDSCYYVHAATRGKIVVEEFLGNVRMRVWVSDRAKAQQGWSDKQQACLAHLLRDAQYAIDCGDTLLAPLVKALLCRAIRVGRNRERLERKFGPGALDAFFWRFSATLQELLEAPTAGNAEAEKFRRSMRRSRDNMFVFLVEEGVPPTNNGSERALRWTAVFRKVTNCFRSLWGAKLHADVRSVIETARRRGIGAMDAIRLTLRGLPLPIPTDPPRAAA